MKTQLNQLKADFRVLCSAHEVTISKWFCKMYIEGQLRVKMKFLWSALLCSIPVPFLGSTIYSFHKL